jgi:hypothetical protein
VRRDLSTLWVASYENIPVTEQLRKKALANIRTARAILDEIEGVYKQKEEVEAA